MLGDLTSVTVESPVPKFFHSKNNISYVLLHLNFLTLKKILD